MRRDTRRRYGRARRRNPIALLLDGLLTLIDRLCEGVATGVMALLRGIGRGLALIAKGIGGLVVLLLRALAFFARRLFALLFARRNASHRCLRLTGEEFEHYVADVLRDNGFRHVQVTQFSGDQGADILAERNGKHYAIQCKNYRGAVGNAAVQEIYAAAEYYECDLAAVICPGEFTAAAQELAESTGVLLWDGERLSRMMRVSGRRPHHKPSND